jgi:hypothetical protein
MKLPKVADKFLAHAKYLRQVAGSLDNRTATHLFKIATDLEDCIGFKEWDERSETNNTVSKIDAAKKALKLRGVNTPGIVSPVAKADKT